MENNEVIPKRRVIICYNDILEAIYNILQLIQYNYNPQNNTVEYKPQEQNIMFDADKFFENKGEEKVKTIVNNLLNFLKTEIFSDYEFRVIEMKNVKDLLLKKIKTELANSTNHIVCIEDTCISSKEFGDLIKEHTNLHELSITRIINKTTGKIFYIKRKNGWGRDLKTLKKDLENIIRKTNKPLKVTLVDDDLFSKTRGTIDYIKEFLEQNNNIKVTKICAYQINQCRANQYKKDGIEIEYNNIFDENTKDMFNLKNLCEFLLGAGKCYFDTKTKRIIQPSYTLPYGNPGDAGVPKEKFELFSKKAHEFSIELFNFLNECVCPLNCCLYKFWTIITGQSENLICLEHVLLATEKTKIRNYERMSVTNYLQLLLELIDEQKTRKRPDVSIYRRPTLSRKEKKFSPDCLINIQYE
jgi:hypothetical protein